MKKKRNRKVTGRFLTTNRLPKEKPTPEEIAEGQRDYDIRKITKEEQAAGSPYWGWMAQHGQQTEDGEIIESPLANPDTLAEGVVYESYDEAAQQMQDRYALTRRAIKEVLTEKQRHIMMLVIDGFSQEDIARNIGMKQQTVSRYINQSRKKLEEYMQSHGVE